MAKLYNLTDAAEYLGVHKATVSRHRAKLGVGQRVGDTYVLTLAEVRRIGKSQSRAGPGNPGKRAKNGRFLPRKKS